MRLALLGTGGYHPSETRHTAAFLLPDLGILLDAGTGVFRLADFLEGNALDVFLSHAHLDHVVGLTYLLGLERAKKLSRVTVHGAPEKLAAVQRHLFSEALFPVPFAGEFRPLAQNVPVAGGGVLRHFSLPHPGGVLGFRIDWPNRSLAYVTDTHASAEATYVEAIRGVDLLLHECNFRADDEPLALKTGHSSTAEVARLARRAAVGRLVLVHLDPLGTPDDPVDLALARGLFPNCELGTDRTVLEF